VSEPGPLAERRDTGQSRSLEYRVNFFYNDHGHLKQISPWHDIPLYANDGVARSSEG